MNTTPGSAAKPAETRCRSRPRAATACQASLLVALFAAGNETAHSAHSVDELYRDGIVRDAALSPDGKRVAMAFRQSGQDGDVVVVVDAQRVGQPDAFRKFSVAEPGRMHMEWIGWATDARLLVGVRIRSDAQMIALGFKPVERVVLPSVRRVIAMDVDGRNPVGLFSSSRTILRRTFNLSRVVDYTPEDPQHVLMAAWSGTSFDLFKVDVFTGVATRVVRGRSNTVGWDTEEGIPALRYDSNLRGTVVSVYGRDAEDEDDWSLIVKYRLKEDTRDWEYAGDAPGAGKIYVRTRREGIDTENIYAFDIPSKTIGELVAQVPGYDMRAAFQIDGKYAGANYIGDRLTYLLDDRKLQRHFNAIETYFKGDANVVISGVDTARSRMLIYAEGPRSPGDYYVYDIATAKLDFLMSTRSWLQPEQLAGTEIRKSPTRDGKTITSYLTRPAGRTGPLPLVVMPHGGPEQRDQVKFDPMVQSLAAQGWLVLQPNFRGSSGYGRAFAEAGHRQWAGRMQDDVTDAVNDVVANDIADRDRIAIFGGSYGGYAALAGAVVTPDLYRAAVSLAGPGDLVAMLHYERKHDGADSESYLYWRTIIGDPKLDKAAIEAVSPEFNVARIRIPVLLVHGTEDEVVPFEQSQKMKVALEKAGKPVRLVQFEGEGHSYWSTSNNVKLLNHVIDFLKPVLEPAATPAESPASAVPGQ